MPNLPHDTISRLLKPFVALDDHRLSQTSVYLELILKWNTRISLTAVRRPEEMVARHFGESFFAAHRLLQAGIVSVVDLGSGAGFPGLPMAMLAPQAQVTLIESHGKKAVFLKEVIRTLQPGNVQVFNGRGEDYEGKADLVIMRAVEKFAASLALASRIVGSGGRLALMIGSKQIEAAIKSNQNLDWADPIEIPGGHSRVLLVGYKSRKSEV